MNAAQILIVLVGAIVFAAVFEISVRRRSRASLPVAVLAFFVIAASCVFGMGWAQGGTQ